MAGHMTELRIGEFSDSHFNSDEETVITIIHFLYNMILYDII